MFVVSYRRSDIHFYWRSIGLVSGTPLPLSRGLHVNRALPTHFQLMTLITYGESRQIQSRARAVRNIES